MELDASCLVERSCAVDEKSNNNSNRAGNAWSVGCSPPRLGGLSRPEVFVEYAETSSFGPDDNAALAEIYDLTVGIENQIAQKFMHGDPRCEASDRGGGLLSDVEAADQGRRLFRLQGPPTAPRPINEMKSVGRVSMLQNELGMKANNESVANTVADFYDWLCGFESGCAQNIANVIGNGGFRHRVTDTYPGLVWRYFSKARGPLGGGLRPPSEVRLARPLGEEWDASRSPGLGAPFRLVAAPPDQETGSPKGTPVEGDRERQDQSRRPKAAASGLPWGGCGRRPTTHKGWHQQ